MCGSLALFPYRVLAENPQNTKGSVSPRGHPNPAHGGLGQQPLGHAGGPAVGTEPEPPSAFQTLRDAGRRDQLGGRGCRAVTPGSPGPSCCRWPARSRRGLQWFPTRSPRSGGAEGARCPPIPPICRLGRPWKQSRGLWGCCSSPSSGWDPSAQQEQPQASPGGRAGVSPPGSPEPPSGAAPSPCPVPGDPPAPRAGGSCRDSPATGTIIA